MNTVIEHIQSTYPDEQRDGQVIYRAVAKEKPAGKPLTERRIVSEINVVCKR